MSTTPASPSAPRPATAAASDPERRLTTQGLERKRQLIDCAASLFAERGYAETRIKDIVDAAGVAKGLFYWYFDNKEALFAEVADDIRLRLRKHQARAIDSTAAPLTQIRQGAAASLRFMADNAHFFSLLEVETDAVTAESRRRGTMQHVSDVKVLIEAGQRDGTIVGEDPDLLALGVVGAVGYHSHYHRTGRSTATIDELADYVGRVVVRMLVADGGVLESTLDRR